MPQRVDTNYKYSVFAPYKVLNKLNTHLKTITPNNQCEDIIYPGFKITINTKIVHFEALQCELKQILNIFRKHRATFFTFVGFEQNGSL